jgi:hypothetical protein
MQLIDAVIGIRKIDKTFHGTGKPLCRKSRSGFFTAHNNNLAMPIKVVWQQSIFIREIIPCADLI